MSINGQGDNFGQEKIDKWVSRVSNMSKDNIKKLQQRANGSDYTIHQTIQKSTYMQQEISSEQQQQTSSHQQKINKQKIVYSSQYSSKKETSLYQQKKLQQYNMKKQQNNTHQIKGQQKQQYESISSDRSQQREKQIGNVIEKKSSYKSEYSNKNISSVQGSFVAKEQNRSIVSQVDSVKNNNIIIKSDMKNITNVIKSESKMLQQSIPINYSNHHEDENDNNTHATFRVSGSRLRDNSNMVGSKFTNIKEGFQSQQAIRSQTFKPTSNSHAASITSSSNKSSSNYIDKTNKQLNDKSQKESNRPYEELKYPSIIIKSSNQLIKSSSIRSGSNKQQQFEYGRQQDPSSQKKNYMKSQHQKNYALTMKKVTSYESPKRSQSIENKKLINSHGEKCQSVKYYNHDKHDGDKEEGKEEGKGLGKNKYKRQQNNDFKGMQQQSTKPNMFYVSISGQQMYPNLDLKKGLANQNITIIDNKFIQDEKQLSNQRAIRNKNLQKGQKNTSISSSPQSSLDPNLPYKIKISQYRSQYFLKVQTQVFTIMIEYPPNNKNIQLKPIKTNQPINSIPIKQSHGQVYSIQRRFSDFVFLYQSIVTNHLGYIIYPFPQKSLQSFVKIKLQSLIGNTIISDPTSQHEAQKMQLIQRRIQELQHFVNFLLKHDELKYSQQLAIFLTPDQQLYMKSRQRITKYIEQYKELQSSGNILQQGKKNIKKVIQTGYGMVMRWLSSQNSSSNNSKIAQNSIISVNNRNSISNNFTTTITNNNRKKSTNNINIPNQPQLQQQFTNYSQLIQTCYAKFNMLQRSLNKIIQMYQKMIGFKDIDTQFDYLMKLCAKVSSGKEYTKAMKVVVGEDVLRDVEVMRRWLEQVRGQLGKREELKLLVQQLKQSSGYNGDLTAKISKLQRRLDRFDKNFRFGFNQLIQQCQQTFQKSKTKFTNQWQLHCKNMNKIWK